MGAVDLIKCFFFFLVFGYVEKIYAVGFGVGLLMGLHSFWKHRSIPILLISLIETGLHFFELKQLSYVCFLVVDFIFVYYEPPIIFNIEDNSSDMHIKFRPYEKEIRSLLFKRQPSILHRVDSLLDKFRGHEKELYMELQDEFLQPKYDSQQKSPKKIASDNRKTFSTTPSKAYADDDIIRPGMSSLDVETIHTAMYRARQEVASRTPQTAGRVADPRL